MRVHPLSLQEVALLCVVSSESSWGEEKEELGLYIGVLVVIGLAKCWA